MINAASCVLTFLLTASPTLFADQFERAAGPGQAVKQTTSYPITNGLHPHLGPEVLVFCDSAFGEQLCQANIEAANRNYPDSGLSFHYWPEPLSRGPAIRLIPSGDCSGSTLPFASFDQVRSIRLPGLGDCGPQPLDTALAAHEFGHHAFGFIHDHQAPGAWHCLAFKDYNRIHWSRLYQFTGVSDYQREGMTRPSCAERKRSIMGYIPGLAFDWLDNTPIARPLTTTTANRRAARQIVTWWRANQGTLLPLPTRPTSVANYLTITQNEVIFHIPGSPDMRGGCAPGRLTPDLIVDKDRGLIADQPLAALGYRYDGAVHHARMSLVAARQAAGPGVWIQFRDDEVIVQIYVRDDLERDRLRALKGRV